MAKPTDAEIIAALEAAMNSLGDAQSMSCTDELPTLYDDAELVEDVLERLKIAVAVQARFTP